MRQNKELTELTKKFLSDFFAACPDDTPSYAFNYIFPEILAECAPHNLDTEFYFPYMGWGFIEETIAEFFKKYMQKFPTKLQQIIDQYPRDYRDERYCLQDWVEDTVEVETSDCGYVDGKYTLKGFKKVFVRRVSFVYYQVNNGHKNKVECVYSDSEDFNYIRTINLYDETGVHILEVSNSYDNTVEPKKIVDYKYVRDVNSTINAINYIAQCIENNEKFED